MTASSIHLLLLFFLFFLPFSFLFVTLILAACQCTTAQASKSLGPARVVTELRELLQQTTFSLGHLLLKLLDLFLLPRLCQRTRSQATVLSSWEASCSKTTGGKAPRQPRNRSCPPQPTAAQDPSRLPTASLEEVASVPGASFSSWTSSSAHPPQARGLCTVVERRQLHGNRHFDVTVPRPEPAIPAALCSVAACTVNVHQLPGPARKTTKMNRSPLNETGALVVVVGDAWWWLVVGVVERWGLWWRAAATSIRTVKRSCRWNARS